MHRSLSSRLILLSCRKGISVKKVRAALVGKEIWGLCRLDCIKQLVRLWARQPEWLQLSARVWQASTSAEMQGAAQQVAGRPAGVGKEMGMRNVLFQDGSRQAVQGISSR